MSQPAKCYVVVACKDWNELVTAIGVFTDPEKAKAFVVDCEARIASRPVLKPWSGHVAVEQYRRLFAEWCAIEGNDRLKEYDSFDVDETELFLDIFCNRPECGMFGVTEHG